MRSLLDINLLSVNDIQSGCKVLFVCMHPDALQIVYYVIIRIGIIKQVINGLVFSVQLGVCCG